MCTALLWEVARPGMASSSRSRHKKATRDTDCTAVITELVQGRRFIMAHPTQHRGWIDGANLRMAIASMAVAILIITASHIAVAQTFTALHGFNGMPDGATPIGGLTMDRVGVGGDYYDFLALPAGKLGIAIGDVSGKGIAAALMMASLQASLRSEATRASDNLAGMMGNVNRLVYEASSSNRYATFFYGQYDPVSRQLTYVNAGHNPPMLFHPYNGECQVSRLEACGTVVGLLENASYQQADLTITPGDILVAFTDGVSEAMTHEDKEWREERLIGRIKCCVGLSPTEIISCIMRNADAFSDGAKQNDDMTLVVVCAQPEIGK